MKYTIVQSLRCEYRTVQPAGEAISIVNCPSCGAVTCDHEAELSLSMVGKINRVCKFAKKIAQEKWIVQTKMDEQEAAEMTSFYTDHYDENENWIG